MAMCQCAAQQDVKVNQVLVQQGALLHDIGRSLIQDVRHASRGSALLHEQGWPEDVVRIVDRHTGAGIDAEDAAVLGLPVRDYTPQTLEEKIVAHADNLYSGEKRLSLEQVLAKYEAKGLSSAARKIANLHAELERRLGCELDALRPAALPPP